MALVVDTGPLYATLDADDTHHAACVALLQDTGERRVVPAPVLPEVDFLCHRGGRREAFGNLLRDIRAGSLRVVDLTAADYARVEALLDTYADLRAGFVDAAVLAIVERLGETKLATLDHRHFATMRPRHTASLELLPA